MLINIHLIRHGMTKSNKEARFVGILDEPLIDEGVEGIKALWLGKQPVSEKLYSSPMVRCRQTAELIFGDTEQIVIDNLRECNFGIFEGKTHDELMAMPEYVEFRTKTGKSDMPGGEKNADFMARTTDAFKDIIKDAEANSLQNVSVVCHGGVIMAIMSTYFPSENGFYDYHVGNGGGYTVCYDCVSETLSLVQELL